MIDDYKLVRIDSLGPCTCPQGNSRSFYSPCPQHDAAPTEAMMRVVEAAQEVCRLRREFEAVKEQMFPAMNLLRRIEFATKKLDETLAALKAREADHD